jgi:hypothetical protein
VTKAAITRSLTGNFNEFYLLLLGSICGILIVAYQYARNEIAVNPAGAIILLIAGFGVLFCVRRKCDPVGYKLALLGVMFITLAYLAWPNRSEWPGWHDQSYYVRMTSELSQGYLTANSFRYGFGYPILAVPFYFMVGNDALFVPNVVAFAGTVYFAYLIFRSLTTDLVAKIAVLFMMFATTLPFHHVIWWGHGVTIFCLILLTYVALGQLTTKKLLLAGAVTGYAFFTRYLDVIVFLPIVIYVFKRSKTKGVALTLLGAAPFLLLTIVAHWLVFGDPFMTPYRTDAGSMLSSFWLASIPSNFFLTFLYFPKNLAEGMVGLGMPKVTVLIESFYLIVAPLGAYLLHKVSDRKGIVLAMIASAVVCVLYSSAYYQFHGGTFGFYPSDFRYILLAYPYLVLFSVVGLFSLLDIGRDGKQATKDEKRHE